jgi:hypothetical protein
MPLGCFGKQNLLEFHVQNHEIQEIEYLVNSYKISKHEKVSMLRFNICKISS